MMRSKSFICNAVAFLIFSTQTKLVRPFSFVTSNENSETAKQQEAAVASYNEANNITVDNTNNPQYAYVMSAQNEASQLDWSITFIEDSTTVVIDDHNVNIIQQYEVGNVNKINVEIYSHDCKTKDDGNLFAPDFKSEASDEKFKLNVNINVTEDNIMGSTYWNSESEELSFCVRVDLLAGSEISISFYETQVLLSVDMTVDFTSGEVTVNKMSPKAETTDTNIWYEVDACLCGGAEDLECSTTPVIRQNERYSICITPADDIVDIVKVLSITASQDDSEKAYPIRDENKDALTVLNTIGQTFVVTSWPISAFFEGENPTEVTVSGNVLLSFQENTSRRLRMDDGEGRILSTDSASFDVSMSPQKEDLTPSEGFRFICGFKFVFLSLFPFLLSL